MTRRFIRRLREEWAGPLERLGVQFFALLAGLVRCAQAQGVPQQALQCRSLLVRTAHAVWGLGAPVAVFAGQVHQESGWRAGAVSHVGAAGLSQFMPATARWIAPTGPALAAGDPFIQPGLGATRPGGLRQVPV